MDNSTLAYSVVGSGTPVVLLHGFCEDASMWDDIIQQGTGDLKFILIDLPGFGKSTIDKSYSIKEIADAVYSTLESMNLKKYFLLGHSMGGYVALSFAKKYSNFLLGLGLIHSHPFADSVEQKENRQKAINFIEQFGSTLYIKQIIPALFPKSFVSSNRFLLEKLVFNASKYPVLGITNALEAMKDRPEQTNVLKELSIPFLSIIGKKDQLLATEELLKQASMANLTQLEFLQRVGHMGPFENPDSINRIIKSFVDNFAR